MTDWTTCAPGNFMRWSGAVWTIASNLNGKLLLDNLDVPGDHKRLGMDDWQSQISDGLLEMLEHPHAELPEQVRDLVGVAHGALPKSMLAAVGFVHELRPTCADEFWPTSR